MSTEHPLTLYNSLTRQKEPFVPLSGTPTPDNPVTMYNCGPTVYSYAHIGNARAAVVADVLFRVLRHIYGEDCVKYARNITDVDDKIIKAATEQNVEMSEITEKFARIYNEDLAALNCLPPTVQPKATNHIGNMIEMIGELIKNDFAYESDGHVFFDVSKYDSYGRLSGNTLDALRGGDRVGEGEVARKRNAADFVLWKPELGGVGWDAPFGRGRPGWHIECSAMAKATLGEVIDIHCGGVDLKFPHHENEIAQSCCANGHESFAKYWVHNEFLNMGSEKMSKSLGNVTLVHDLLEKWDGEVIRLAMLKAHYRSELNWSEDLLRESKAQLDGWYKVIQEADIHQLRTGVIDPRFSEKIYDDINSIEGISYFSNFVKFVRLSRQSDDKIRDQIQIHGFHKPTHLEENSAADFVKSANLLGLLQRDPEDWFSGNASDDDKAQFDTLAERRQAARAAKDWPAADAARDEAKALGIILEDGPDGTTWRKA